MSSLPNLNTASLNSTLNGFWEIGSYKANVQRIHRGSDQLDELSRFIKERMSIENNYAKHLERWNDDWCHYSEKHLTDGSMKHSFALILDESRELAKVHSSVKERFNDEVLKTIELFKRDNYHRSTFRGFREAKEVEDEFEKAQKQWKKLFERVEMTKRTYHSAARTEKSTYIQYMNSKTDSAQSDGSEDKARERFDKCHQEVTKARTAYEQLLKELTSYNGVYMENMAFVFEKCQQMEMKRLRFALEMLSGMQKILVDLVNPPKLVQLHAKLRQHFLSTTDASIGEDLKRWSLHHGVDCSTKWPQFEEYSAEFRHFSGSKTRREQQKQQQQSETTVVLTKKVMKDEDESPQSGSRFRSYVSEMGEDGEVDGSIGIRTGDNDGGRRNPTTKVNDVNTSRILVNNTNTVQQQKPAVVVDSLNADLFPMVTPQNKGRQSAGKGNEQNCAANGNGHGILRQEIGEHSIANGKRKDSEPTARQEEAEFISDHNAAEEMDRPNSTDDNIPIPPPLPVGPAKALYDYEPIEGDEIKLVKGEFVDIISGPDHLGWCLGAKKDGSTGLFPAGYVLPMGTSECRRC
uniref:SH3 domain-containing protein n=1 Tax=Globodera pallida TaxID=36090 RepID=A0A183BM75_GLOPA